MSYVARRTGITCRWGSSQRHSAFAETASSLGLIARVRHWILVGHRDSNGKGSRSQVSRHHSASPNENTMRDTSRRDVPHPGLREVDAARNCSVTESARIRPRSILAPLQRHAEYRLSRGSVAAWPTSEKSHPSQAFGGPEAIYLKVRSYLRSPIGAMRLL